MRSVLCGLVVGLAVLSDAAANGRPAATSTINFQQGNDQHIVAGMTFGVLFSEDGGETWRWACEGMVRYGGQYDPDYAYTSTGAIFATTFDGSLVNRAGCSFDPTVHGTKFISSLAHGPDGAVYMAAAHAADPAASQPADRKIYKSTDNGMTFPVATSATDEGDWWNSIEVAPTDANRVYLAGYKLTPDGREFLLFTSTDGGATWTPMPQTGLTTTRNSTVDIIGISRQNASHVYARVSFQNENALGDAIFRSTDAGQTWTKILDKPDELFFVVRANGDLVAGSRSAGAWVSRAPSNGDSWETLTGAPHINCLVENTAREVWACTQNFGYTGVPSDGAGIMKSTDLVTWSVVLRFQDIDGPLSCAPGTIQKEQCAPMWCGLKAMMGITSTEVDCPALTDGPPGDSGIGGIVDVPAKGCCDSGSSELRTAVMGLAGLALLRRRKRAR